MSLSFYYLDHPATTTVSSHNNVSDNIYIPHDFLNFFFCVGVMYSGEYDACDVTLSVYPQRASLKNMPDHGGNRTYDTEKKEKNHDYY
jgi:hypothetical protein